MGKNRQRHESSIALGAYHARKGYPPYWKYHWQKATYMQGYNSVANRKRKAPPDGWVTRGLKWLLSKMFPEK